jgi:hypothetical protein
MPLTESAVIGAADILVGQRRISDYHADDSSGAQSVDKVDDVEKTVVDMSKSDSECNLEDRMQKYQESK